MVDTFNQFESAAYISEIFICTLIALIYIDIVCMARWTPSYEVQRTVCMTLLILSIL